ncbi:MAG: lipoyl synthase, partial [Candidatus Omnitrophica bacterium]|nr:lipoyl synthase [Candidatus Omnitrophota bacterium]
MENRLPAWFKQDLISTQALEFSRALRNEFRLNTVCHSAKCPNMPHCFSRHHATFMILGDSCTRQCKFCNVKKHSSQELTLDKDEPYRIAEAVKSFNLEYAVITSVTRDDLCDGGAGHFVKTIKAIRGLNPDTEIEVLIPDFNGSLKALGVIVKERPEVISHNLETVENIFPLVRNVAD